MRTSPSLDPETALSSDSLKAMSGTPLQFLFAATSMFLGAVCPSFSSVICRVAEIPAQQGTSANSRPCTTNPVLAPSSKSNSARNAKHPSPADPLPACIEIKGQPIEIQEFLQSAVREFQWRIGENHASEDTWTFVRYLSDRELAHCGDTKILVESVQFSGGKAAVLLHTTEMGDGYARVQISAHIQGEGSSTDKMSSQNSSSWPLRSTGALEQELIRSLQTRYKPI